MTTQERLLQIYNLLSDRFGPQHWWPGDTPFEVAVGAILTQNTNWSNVEKALDNLKQAGCFSAAQLYALPQERLAEHIRPAGYFRRKAERLRHFLTWLCEEYGADLSNLASLSTASLREDLLAIKGIGPETADSILLYALERPSFVVDTYTARIAVRHGLIEPPFDYHNLQALFVDHLPQEVALYNEYHALIVATGKHFCKPKPRCEGCPLSELPRTFEFEG